MSEIRNGAPETIYITQGDYNEIVRKLKKIDRCVAYNEEEGNTYFDPMLFPKEEDLEEKDVRHNIRKYLPYLIFYREPEIFDIDDDDFRETRRYIEDLFEEYVIIMEDEDCQPVRDVSAEKWQEMTLEEKCQLFRPMIEYYEIHEFDGFYKDLGWQPFMRWSGCTKKQYLEEGGNIEEIKKELMVIWETVFKNISEEIAQRARRAKEGRIKKMAELGYEYRPIQPV